MKNGVKWRIQTLTPRKERLVWEIKNIGADPYALNMWAKGAAFAVKVAEVKAGAANIIKQEAIASGIDALVNKGTVNCSVEKTDVVILGSVNGVKILINRLRRQGFSLPQLADCLEALLYPVKNETLHMRKRTLDLRIPRIMGIVNITPDSFSDGGKFTMADAFKKRMDAIIKDGASFIDIGGVSTRPGHTVPSVEEELERVMPAVEYAVQVAKNSETFISIDAWRYEVVKACVDAGIDMINDQSGLKDDRLAELAAESKTALCLMHNHEHGERDLMARLNNFFADKLLIALNTGVETDSIVLDPGFGFVKSVQDNYLVLQYFSELCSLGYPLLAGISRKSMIGEATGRPVQERDAGTLAAEVIAASKGARIIRTHNVAACADAMKVLERAENTAFI